MKCGLEIHQQLDTKEKLFCKCPTKGSAVIKTFERELRAVHGELGQLDLAALEETEKGRKYLYRIFDNCCLIELDEEPPREINPEALKIALKFAIMLECEIPEEIHVMRKTVVDGSNTSGFQRTAIIGMNGKIKTSAGTVKIKNVNLEEESCSIEKVENQKVIYNLERLGIPLVEVGTEADIKSSEHAKETALKIGMLLRSLGKVKRGLGTIRQDVNVSIPRGARVEIKGFQEVKAIDKLIGLEIERQKNLLRIKEKLKDRKIDNLKIFDVTPFFKNAEHKLISDEIKSGKKVFAFKAEIKDLAAEKISGEKTVARELADYAKAYNSGIIHSLEAEKYNLSKEFSKLEKFLKAKEKDLIIISAGRNSFKAISKVSERVKLLNKKIPEETRASNRDFTTRYLRPLPGAARMYPETDITPIFIKKSLLEKLGKEIPKTIEEKILEYSKIIGNELAEQIVNSEHFDLFEALTSKLGMHKELASTLVNVLPDIKTRLKLDVGKIKRKHLETIFKMLKNGKITYHAIREILAEICLGKEPYEVIEKRNLWRISDEELKVKIKELINSGIERNSLMKEAMRTFKFKAEPKRILEIISEIQKQR